MSEIFFRVFVKSGENEFGNYAKKLSIYSPWDCIYSPRPPGLYVQTLLIIILLSTTISPGRIQKPPPAFQTVEGFLVKYIPRKNNRYRLDCVAMLNTNFWNTANQLVQSFHTIVKFGCKILEKVENIGL